MPENAARGPAHEPVRLDTRTSRRRFLALTAGIAGAGALGKWGLPRLLAAEDRATLARPNVVLFVIDTLRADRVNAYGCQRPGLTPHIDALADEAVLFQQAYAAAPWTLPSMASVFTSRFACEHQALSTRTRMPSGVATLPERLRELGYTTLGLYANAMVGPEFGFARGFDFYQGSAVNAAEQVQAALALQSGSPYFLYVHNLEPHNPELEAPLHTPGFRDVAPAVRDELHRLYRAFRTAERVDYSAGRTPGLTDTTADQDAALAALRERLGDWTELYDAAVHLADARLGSVIAHLKSRGAWDRTLFILMADHGEEFFEHDGWTHGQAVYDEQVRVPLLIKYPNHRWAGTRMIEPVSLIDLLPTVFDYMECQAVASDAAGRSLLPLSDPRSRALPPVPMVTSFRHNVMNHYRPRKERIGDINVVVRSGRYKAIWNVEPDRVELYNLGDDPQERCDLAARLPERADEMKRRAIAWYEDCGRRAGSGDQSIDGFDPATNARLRTLGYVD